MESKNFQGKSERRRDSKSFVCSAEWDCSSFFGPVEMIRQTSFWVLVTGTNKRLLQSNYGLQKLFQSSSSELFQNDTVPNLLENTRLIDLETPSAPFQTFKNFKTDLFFFPKKATAIKRTNIGLQISAGTKTYGR